MPVSSVVLGSWKEIHSYLKPGWIYRGQKSTKWPLKTSLERCCEREGVKPKDKIGIEEKLCRDFQRAYHQYAQHLPAPESVIEWMSLMQHHGAPTRLLDFTYSLYVAAYFALEAAESDCAVWAMRAPWASRESVEVFRRVKKGYAEQLLTPTIQSHEAHAGNSLFTKPFVKATIPLTPFRLSQRLCTQRATFIAPGTISDSFMDNLLALSGHEQPSNCIKITIRKKMRSEAVEHLFAMNITRRSLFPGLDGYAESLGVFHPSFRPDPYLQK